MSNDHSNIAAGEQSRRLFVFNGGFLTQPRVRRILALSGLDIKVGKPNETDLIGVWGQSPTSHRGENISARSNASVVRIEDAFLRSVLPARISKEPPLGLCIDHSGVHFDPSVPSDLEDILANAPLDDTALLNRARAAIERINELKLSKYNAYDPDVSPPDPGYVLVIDQTRDDASVLASGADLTRFKEMLVFAQTEHPAANVIIKTHPETVGGAREGYFSEADETARVKLYAENIAPQTLFEGAVAVYTVSSQMGFEAIFSGHKPRVFGQPFYAGWGLTQDEYPVPRRERKLSRAQLFAAAMILYPKWYDPYDDRLCELEDVIETLAVFARAWREDRDGYIAYGMRLWKRRTLQQYFGRFHPLTFCAKPEDAIRRAHEAGRPLLVWANRADPSLLTHANTTQTPVIRAEDGFLRSHGLGADLVPPMSLITDNLGVYYDPRSESRLERLIAQSTELSSDNLERAARLRTQIIETGLSKYNLQTAPLPRLPDGHRILVVGQVEDDASIKLGCQKVSTNRALLQETRRRNPDAVILYKPHPDTEAGLRTGAIAEADALEFCDLVLNEADPISVLEAVNEVWTMTSLLGFEALLRGIPVTCLGTPFYAGWGLTTDLGEVPARRTAQPPLDGLVHAALIDAPRYFDPKTGLPCPPELIVQRLGETPAKRRGGLKLLAKLQGAFASLAPLWRR
ncbi:capsular polysaccharide biosynthesis protein [Falsihalocynthiibacter sp. SS001]|uniref:capsular polysaccharide biosynthesis protein n=1 Tax=Falsihalocynthiibacter sp. SS001 TaxID=3349698 RepID=UPI0036D3A195